MPPITVHTIATADSQLRVPYSYGWSLQADRELRSGLLLRLGYEERKGYRDLYVNPFQPSAENPELRLWNNGRQSYREFLALVRWRTGERTTLYASYTRSQARGELIMPQLH